mmetsp:Transcript_27333/g.53658  ORF Transcript_27333/g.53658 Transcript_27333/m.53658 type:complete len:88 (-) Transcript_27333:354-617(-)
MGATAAPALAVRTGDRGGTTGAEEEEDEEEEADDDTEADPDEEKLRMTRKRQTRRAPRSVQFLSLDAFWNACAFRSSLSAPFACSSA